MACLSVCNSDVVGTVHRDSMATYRLEGGLYAVFTHRGPATDHSTFAYIFGEWVGSSGYELDDREHFEVLPPGYNPMDPDATEDIWIPVRPLGEG